MKKTSNIILWVAQILLFTSLIWAAYLKILQPITQLQTMWPWTGEVSPAFVRFTGVIDFLGGLGILLPALLKFKPIFTPIAAVGIVLLMISACIFHICRGEASQIGFNLIFGAIAAFVAYGRFKWVPIQ